ncbi:site-specific integrase [Bradyrhizobium manausense]|uniref:site-specific integrase n=1 Tax=Bradyrhizobium manausense TaxID=989370 RepID=UPI001BAE4671|nr:site-specific integrase [Bradyrhizobium manausense]MBR0832014.1 site-specific integrase [Bradyrhizobium manausense]
MLREDPTVTRKQIEDIVASLAGDGDFADEVRLARTGALFDHHGDAPLDADAVVLETFAEEYRIDLARNQTDRVHELAQQRAALVGLDIEPGSLNEKLIGRAILKECIRSFEASASQARERLACLYPELSTDVASTKDAPTASNEDAPAPSRTIMDLYDVFKGEKEDDCKPDTWDQNRKIVQRFAEFVGETSQVSMITRKAVRDWKQALAIWPRKAADVKEFKGLAFHEVIGANARLEKPKPAISKKTVNKYLAAVGPFAAWLLANEYIENDVMTGMYLAVDKNKKPVLPYTEAQIETIFKSALFSTCAGDGLEFQPGNIAIRDWRYWVPWIALYSGARLGEIAQLLTADVRQLHGRWVFHITEEGSEEEADLKSTKTGGSQRVVPIHSKLIKRGFLQYYAEVRARGERRLFPELKRDSRGFFGAASKFFNSYFKAIGVKVDKKLNFHSLRHSAADAFRRGGYRDEEFNVLLGHTEETTTGIYGIIQPGTLKQRVKMIEAVRYSGL